MAQKSVLFSQWLSEYRDKPEYINHRLASDVADLICREMEAQGITRRELAERLGVTPQYITKFLNTPSNTTLLQIVRFAQALGLEVTSPIVARPARKKSSRPAHKPAKPARRVAATSG